jgi:hypothetical protein
MVKKRQPWKLPPLPKGYRFKEPRGRLMIGSDKTNPQGLSIMMV